MNILSASFIQVLSQVSLSKTSSVPLSEENLHVGNPGFGVDEYVLNGTETLDGLVLADDGFDDPVPNVA